MSGKNQKVIVSRCDMGNPASGLEIASQDQPEASSIPPNHVLCEMTMRPVNPADIFSIMGVYPGFDCTVENPVPGLEGVAKVIHSSSGLFTANTRVIGMPWTGVESGNGTWQKYAIAHEDDLLDVSGISDEEAAVFYVNPVTVFGMLADANIPAGETLLQTAAGSVLGRMMIQLCKHKGIKTINVVRRQEQAQELLDLGADHVIVSNEDGSNIAEKVMELTGGKGAYAAIECVGGEIFKACVSSVRPFGTVFIYGAMSGLEMTVSIPDPLFRGVTIKGWWLAHYMKNKSSEEKKAIGKELLDLMQQGLLKPFIGKKFPLDQVKEAIAEATKDARGGKVLLTN
jgi:trans-2-enoyl-CoA reductase